MHRFLLTSFSRHPHCCATWAIGVLAHEKSNELANPEDGKTTVYVLTAGSGDSLAGDASLMAFSSGRSSPLERIDTTSPPIAYRGDGQPSVPDVAPTV